MVAGRPVVDRIRRTDEYHYTLIEKPSTQVQYEGRTDSFRDPDPAAPIWQIKRIAYTDEQWETDFANDGKYNCVWDDRATYFDAPVGPAPPADALTISGEVRYLGLTVEGRITEVTLSDTTWTLLPTSALTDRNAIAVQNFSAANVKLNYSNTIVGFVGVLLAPGSERMYGITDDILLYAKADIDGAVVYVEELA